MEVSTVTNDGSAKETRSVTASGQAIGDVTGLEFPAPDAGLRSTGGAEATSSRRSKFRATQALPDGTSQVEWLAIGAIPVPCAIRLMHRGYDERQQQNPQLQQVEERGHCCTNGATSVPTSASSARYVAARASW